MEEQQSKVENMGLSKNLIETYKNKKVFITGHTGFKGSWLSFWLSKLGAKVTGYSDGFPTIPCHFELLNYNINTIKEDICNYIKLAGAIEKTKPDIIFHLAAQPLVMLSYRFPMTTLETNVMGTAHLLYSAQHSKNLKAIVIITSDKCYENKEWMWGYRENDALGGFDPYSASKACAEIVTASFRNSYFNLNDFGNTHETLIASARAGNVIGGGDWAEDRLIPDIVKATANNEKVVIRNPNYTRPWQHVLDPLYGYLLLGKKLMEGKKEFAEAWNFGPGSDGMCSVIDLVKLMKKDWKEIEFRIAGKEQKEHEAGLLKLDSTKANMKLGWHQIWNLEKSISATSEWYRHFYQNIDVITEKQLVEYNKLLD